MPSSDQIRAKLGLGPRPKPMFGHNRSHALNATRKISKPNLQNKWVVVDGQRYRIKLTARESVPWIRKEYLFYQGSIGSLYIS